jgi:LmbE family N-acetylglucosaminyl deacetylase
MTHVFVAPHPDDAALSCGGLIASLRELGQNVTILTVFSGTGLEAGPAGNGDEAMAGNTSLTPYQREALGFGSKTLWPVTEAFNRANILADVDVPDDSTYLPPWAATEDRIDATQADADQAAKRFWQRSSWYRRANVRNVAHPGAVLVDDISTQGAVLTDEVMDAAAAGELLAHRRIEDERFAYMAEASIVFLDLPDAVFRGYEGDDQLLGTPREDDPAPYERLRTEIARLEPQKVYFPLGVGNHVDHQLCRDVGVALLGEPRRWIMPGPEYAGTVVFYEDFPYAWWAGFTSIDDLPQHAFEAVPPDVQLTPTFADVTDQLEQKIRGISLYESQLDRLFGGRRNMADAVRRYGRALGLQGRIDGAAERYWVTRR